MAEPRCGRSRSTEIRPTELWLPAIDNTMTVSSVVFDHSVYTIRRQVFRLFGAGFQIYSPDGQVVLHSEQKAFRLREDIRVYAEREQQTEVLVIKARQWLDFAAAYDVSDSATGELLGTFRRKGFRSLIRDQWQLADAAGNEIGLIQEDSTALAVARRLLPFADWIPQSFHMTLGATAVCQFRQHFNPIVQRLTVDFSVDPSGSLDKRLGLAAGILLSAIEGRQHREVDVGDI
jgi:uncharacterized protein YxjI